MAYRNNAPVEHAYKRIARELKEGTLGNILYFFGREEFLIDWAIHAIEKQFVNAACRELDFSKLDGQTVTFEEIRNNCETLAMMSEKRVVWLMDFKPIEGGKGKAFTEADEKNLLNYLKDFPTSCILIITGTGQTPDKRKKLYKTVADVGSVYDFCALDEKLLKAFIEKRVRLAGKMIRPGVLTEFVNLSGYFDKETDYTLFHLSNDMKKVIAYSEGEEILPRDVQQTISGNIDTNVFAMIDALSQNRKDLAFQLLHNQFVHGENVYRLLSLICSQFELILAMKEMKENAMSLAEMKKILGVHEFRIKKASAFADRYSVGHLKAVLQKAYEVDKNIKTGLLESSLALEMFIAEI